MKKPTKHAARPLLDECWWTVRVRALTGGRRTVEQQFHTGDMCWRRRWREDAEGHRGSIQYRLERITARRLGQQALVHERSTSPWCPDPEAARLAARTELVAVEYIGPPIASGPGSVGRALRKARELCDIAGPLPADLPLLVPVIQPAKSWRGKIIKRRFTRQQINGDDSDAMSTKETQ